MIHGGELLEVLATALWIHLVVSIEDGDSENVPLSGIELGYYWCIPLPTSIPILHCFVSFQLPFQLVPLCSPSLRQRLKCTPSLILPHHIEPSSRHLFNLTHLPSLLPSPFQAFSPRHLLNNPPNPSRLNLINPSTDLNRITNSFTALQKRYVILHSGVKIWKRPKVEVCGAEFVPCGGAVCVLSVEGVIM